MKVVKWVGADMHLADFRGVRLRDTCMYVSDLLFQKGQSRRAAMEGCIFRNVCVSFRGGNARTSRASLC